MKGNWMGHKSHRSGNKRTIRFKSRMKRVWYVTARMFKGVKVI